MKTILYVYFFVIAAWMISEMWIFIRERNGTGSNQDRNSRRIVVLCVVAAVAFMEFVAPHLVHIKLVEVRAEALTIGTAVMIAGLVLRVRSVLTLGRFFRSTVTIQESHQVIQHGVYKYIRHPSYLGVLILVTGLGIASNSLLSLFGTDLIIFVGMQYRIAVEEQVLSSELGRDYQDYISRTKRLFPFVY